MAAASYYNSNEDTQHLLHDHSSSSPSKGQHSPLKPMLLVESHGQGHANVVGSSNHYFQQEQEIEYIKEIQREDEHLKARIRRLRLVSRIIAFLISIAVFIPITITLHKFLTTQNTYKDVRQKNGMIIHRTAWAKDTKSWPSYMYFAVAATSVVLNFVIILSYGCGVQQANRAATIATVFSWGVMIGNLAVWSVAAALYRQQKNLNGKSNDLWGWTCSAAAKEIQHAFSDNINFDKYCNTQAISWYAGLVQVGAAILSVFIYFLVVKRRKTKKTVQRHSRRLGGFEPFRR